MNIQTNRKTVVMLGKLDILKLLKDADPDCLTIRAIPDDGKDVKLFNGKAEINVLTLIHEKTVTVGE